MAGVTVAYHAPRNALEGNEQKTIDGFTPERRFFLSWAQVWRRNYRPESLKLQVNTNPYSPSKFRVIRPARDHSRARPKPSTARKATITTPARGTTPAFRR